MFLEISQISQEETCARVSLLTKFNKVIKRETLAQVFSCEFCEIFKNTFLTEHLGRLLLKEVFNNYNKVGSWFDHEEKLGDFESCSENASGSKIVIPEENKITMIGKVILNMMNIRMTQ